MKTNEPLKRGKGGRPPKNDKAVYRYSVNFSAEEHARFLSLFEKSGLVSIAAFIKARVFDESFRVVKADQGTLEFVAKLTTFHAQFRAIGVNYNQVVREMHTNYSDKKAYALLKKLEKATEELVGIGQKIIALSKEFQTKW